MKLQKTNLIGISGHINSGKDLAGTLLQKKYSRQNFQIKKFADKLKERIAYTWNISRESLEDREFKDMLSPLGISWRELMQREGVKMREIDPDYWVKALFSEFNSYWNDPSPIEGNNYKINSLRNMGEDVFGITYNNGISEAEVYKNEIIHPKWIITDVRFPNEAISIKERNGTLIRINRPSLEKDTHISETALDDYTDWDYVIENNSTLKNFIQKF